MPSKLPATSTPSAASGSTLKGAWAQGAPRSNNNIPTRPNPNAQARGQRPGPTNNLAKSYAASRAPATNAPPASSIITGVNNMTLNQNTDGHKIKVWDPSCGPTDTVLAPESMSAWKERLKTGIASSKFGSAVSVRHPWLNNVSRASRYNRTHFRKGDIIAIPFHTANTNPDIDPNDEALRITIWGPVYSKRRMVIVLWIYQRDMFCLPLYTFNKTGIRGKAEHLQHEYVSVRNAGKPHVQQGVHEAIDVVPIYKDMDDDSAVVLSAGLRVGCNEDITFVGRTTKKGYHDLVKLWKDLSGNAQNGDW